MPGMPRTVCQSGATPGLGGVVSVLKQERYEIYQEATALTRDQAPQPHRWGDRAVQLWEAKDLSFTDAAIGPMRVVLAQEQWRQARRVGGRKKSWKTSRVPGAGWSAGNWTDTAQAIWQIGHQRWGIENHAFNELTQRTTLENTVLITSRWRSWPGC